MSTTSKLLKTLAVLSALLPFCTSGFASIVYDNSANNLNKTYAPQPDPNGVQFGDEINLAAGDRLITNFKFEYFLSGNASGNETAVLQLLRNDGATITRTVDGSSFDVQAPGSVLYTSPVLSLQSGFQTAEASGFTPFEAPNNFTWTITFSGVDPGEVAGLLVYDPPTVGSSFSDFWQNNGGSWNTYLLPNDPITGNPVVGNFAARVTAVPEPTTLALGLLAGLSFLGYFGYKRRSV